MIQEIFEQWFLTNKCNAAAKSMSEILKSISPGFQTSGASVGQRHWKKIHTKVMDAHHLRT